VSREIAVIPLIAEVNPEFAMFMLAAPTSQEKMRGHLRGTAYVGINLKDVRNLEIPVPSRAQQAGIVKEISDFQVKNDEVLKFQSQTFLWTGCDHTFGSRSRFSRRVVISSTRPLL
jgi:type I restriction enzyme S subunit